ncbi:MAG: hypothetical protein IPF92_16410 [Myxococcales bacterium]|nr:hypothetical protein [Myxococcales bacterium]MBL0195390.1 hypothetical protein [Myxococcales bacterium]HQY59953.1 hypothetical protein [Polyangiaceae bacterium]
MDPSRCVVLVPYSGHIEIECERALGRLEEEGYIVRRASSSAGIDLQRSQLATDALADGFDELFWIDADIAFDAADVARLRAHDRPLTCGLYAKKGARELACYVHPGTDEIVFGKSGGLLSVRYAGLGFVHTRREVYEAIREVCRLPVCNRRFKRPVVPYFLPMLLDSDDDPEPWYLTEDYAFFERARAAGFGLFADTSVRLWHVGRYRYGWEDAGSTLDRYNTYRFRVKG